MHIYLHHRHLHLWFADSGICPELSFTLWTAPDIFHNITLVIFLWTHHRGIHLIISYKNTHYIFCWNEGGFKMQIYALPFHVNRWQLYRFTGLMSLWIDAAESHHPEELLSAIWPEMCQVHPSQSEGVRGSVYNFQRHNFSSTIIKL